MAIYHCSIKIFSRGKGESAVAKAAYRSGQLIRCEYDGVTHDYTRKGGVVHTEILLPPHAPSEYKDRAVLWNAVEKIERAHNSQLAREIEIALPKELTAIQHRALVRDYVQHTFVDKGMCADIAIHDKKDGNPHAHIMLTIRPLEQDGSWGAKSRKEYILDGNGERIRLASGEYKSRKIPTVDWNDQTKAEVWRAAWAETANRYLEKLNHPARLDHRSYERQGVEQLPSVHLGVAASQMERRGIRTGRGDVNREIEITNAEIRQLKARINKLNIWLKEETTNPTPPTLADVIESSGLKASAQTLDFLRGNDIRDVTDLQNTVKRFYSRQGEVSGKLNMIEGRIKSLGEQIKHTENYRQYRGFKTEYDKLRTEYRALEKSSGFGVKRKLQKALNAANEYHETHRMELTLCETAIRYLQEAIKTTNPLPRAEDLKAERAKLNTEKNALYQKYYALKEDVKKVEGIRREVENVMRAVSRERRPQRSQGLEL